MSLYGGGLEQTYDWNFKSGSPVQINGNYIGRFTDHTTTWTCAYDQYVWISNPKNGYVVDGQQVCIHESKWISNAIQEYNIQPGDLLYFDAGAYIDGNPEHVAMVVSVDNGVITYAQHTGDKNDGNLNKYLDANNAYVYVVRIKDDAE